MKRKVFKIEGIQFKDVKEVAKALAYVNGLHFNYNGKYIKFSCKYLHALDIIHLLENSELVNLGYAIKLTFMIDSLKHFYYIGLPY